MWLDVKYINLLSNKLPQFKKKDQSYNFRCPYCGDSQKNKFKARGYIVSKSGKYFYYCHNCGVSRKFSAFLEEQDKSLHDQYRLESIAERGRENVKIAKAIDTTTTLKFDFPEYRKKGSPLRKLKKISQLEWDHPAKTYILDRKIPNYYHSKLFYCDHFMEWTNTLIPEKFKKVEDRYGPEDEPRIIIPFINKQGQFFGYQGRSFRKDTKYQPSLRYITIMLDESKSKIFGLDDADNGKPIFCTEGPFDSMFVNNCVAMAGSDGYPKFDDVTMIFDNEPRSKQIVDKMFKIANDGIKIVVWPSRLQYKDINDMIVGGLNAADVKLLIDENTYSKLDAMLAINTWKKC